MDHSEQAQNQLQEIDNGAKQIPAAPAFSYAATPVMATSSTLRAPVLPPTLPPPISNPHNRRPRHSAEHFNNLEHRLRLFWESQQLEQTSNFQSHSFPLTRIKKIMQADRDVNMIAAEAPVVFAKAIELFIMDMTLRGWAHTEEDGRRILQKKDIAAAISETDIYDFLADVIPKHLSNPTNVTIPQVGSSSMTYEYVPDQQFAAGPSDTVVHAGGQQPQAYTALPQLQLPLKPFIDWEQAFEPWAPEPEKDNQQQNQESSVTLASQQQQMQQNNQQNQESSMLLAPQPQQLQCNNQQSQVSSMPLAPQPQQMQLNNQKTQESSMPLAPEPQYMQHNKDDNEEF